MRIAVVYDSGAEDWSTADVQSVLACVDATAAALERLGHTVERVAVRTDFAWVDDVRTADAVFNLCEGVAGASHMEYKVASTIELLGIPMTGVSAWTMMICHRKPVLNALLASHELPIPLSTHATDDMDFAGFPLPAIVKPAAEDASVGVDQQAVVTSVSDLRARVASTRKKFGEVVVQRYIAGREVAVAFVGDETLPISEIDFSAMPADHWPIVTFEAKWSPDSPDYVGTVPVCPADLDARLANEITEVATRAWNVVDGKGYGRVDLRLDEGGSPWLLEVNPNPDSSIDAGLANMAAAHGWSYDELVGRILDAAFVTAQPAGAGAPVG